MHRNRSGCTGSGNKRLKENVLADQNKIEYEECIEQSPIRHRIHCQQQQTHQIKHSDLPFSHSHRIKQVDDATVRHNHNTDPIYFIYYLFL